MQHNQHTISAMLKLTQKKSVAHVLSTSILSLSALVRKKKGLNAAEGPTAQMGSAATAVGLVDVFHGVFRIKRSMRNFMKLPEIKNTTRYETLIRNESFPDAQDSGSLETCDIRPCVQTSVRVSFRHMFLFPGS